jgi:hypothetical protein
MIVNFVFSNGLVYFFILISKEIIFLNPTMCHMLEKIIVIYLCNEVLCKLGFSNCPRGQIEIRA